MGWFRTDRDDVLIDVRVTPKGGADRVTGTAFRADGSTVLAVRVKSAPEKGAANAALEKLIARAVGIAPAQVAIVAGQKSRIKTLRITGGSTLCDKLAMLASRQDNGKD